jgi:hypothetical protein
LNEQTCVTKGFDGGTLSCTADCKFDTSGCTDAPADCGNGVVDVGEQCDGANLNEQTCETQGFDGGTLSCTAACQFDTTGCTRIGPDCGNGEIDEGEQCDGANLNEQTCETQGFDGGTLGCTTTCQFDTTGCTKIEPDCGNGEIDGDEQCDGANLNSQSCETQGFDGGTLSCTSDCQFDTSNCTKCGDGNIDEGEQCDGANLNSQSCETQGFDGGTLSCTSDCQFDTSNCTKCGDGNIDEGEQCDGANLDEQTCVDRGFDGGELGCTSTCQFDTTGCTKCGDGNIDEGEQCDGANLNEQTCVDHGFAGGELGCTSTCQFNTAGCTNCGNEELDDGEQCDGPELNERTCVGLGFVDGGTLGCTDQCKFDTSGCLFTCQAVDLGEFSDTITLDTQDSCTGTSFYNAGLMGTSCTRYATNGNEIVYELTVSAGERVLVAVDHTGVDAAIWVTPSCDDIIGAQCIVGVDASSTTSGREELNFINDGGSPKTYYIVVDAFSDCGTFDLTISSLGKCGNGVKESHEECDGLDLEGASCSNFGFIEGTLTCNAQCKLDFTNCNYGSLQPVGGPCTTGADCASGICWDELNMGLPGGYCVDGCREEGGCWDPANICVGYLGNSFCAKKCSPGGSGGCRDAYECYDLGKGNGACWPKCTADSQCSVAGHCDLDSGFCTCPLGQHLEAGTCVYDDCEYLGCANLNRNCDPVGGCSGACAVCTDCVSGTELSSSGRCVRIGAAWGVPCEIDADCPGSGTPGEDTYCDKSGTGGFCMQVEGPDYVGDGQPCTGDPNSVGVSMAYAYWIIPICLQSCTTDVDCRAGYACSTDMDHNHSVLACSPIKDCDTYGCNHDGSLRCASDGKCWLDGCDPNPCTDVPHSTKACVNARDSHMCECVDDYRWDDDSMSCVSFECTAQDLGTVTAEIQLMGEDSCTGTSEYNADGTGVSCTKYSTKGNEKVYKITLPAGASVLIQMEPSGFDASLWVTTACNDISGVKCVEGADDPEEVTITNEGSEPATYYIVADAYRGCGMFNLTITPK